MTAETIKIRLVGERPLLMHSGRLADPLDEIACDLAKVASKRPKPRADHEQVARIEWHGCLWLSNDCPCLPAEAVEASFINAARSRKKTKQARAGLMVMQPSLLDYDGPDAIEELWSNPAFRFRHSVRVGNARTMRTRPRFPTWRAVVVATFLPSLLDRTEEIAIFKIAGFQEGIGDWRPKYGWFTVEEIK